MNSEDQQAELQIFTNKYMMGHCHGLAYALSDLLERDIGVMYAVKAGGRRITDPVHCYIDLGDELILDVKGVRSRNEMRADFDWILDFLGDIDRVEYTSLSDPSDLIGRIGMDPNSIDMAYDDLASCLWAALDLDSLKDTLAKKVQHPAFEHSVSPAT